MSFPQTPLVTLTTDFGHGDSYVAQMKGAILSVNPHARLIDVTHQCPPQHVLRASFMLAEVAATYPKGTVHLCVVDPGVGSDRAIIAAEVNHQFFVCPDNGLLTQVLRRWQPRKIVTVQNPTFWRDDVSATFHGRDVMGPVAAHLSRGLNLRELGPVLQSAPQMLTPPLPQCDSNTLMGRVMWVDTFGNLVTNITRGDLNDQPLSELQVEVGHESLHGVSRCYADAGDGHMLALFGSAGFLEISVNCGNAAKVLEVGEGGTVEISGLVDQATPIDMQAVVRSGS